MSDVCKVPAGMLHNPFPLARVREKLRHGAPLTVVAIGSSSTAGTGASSERANYPSRLAAELRELFPRSRVTVINRGVPGEVSMDMIKRFQRDAIAPNPDLIVWQTGTNSVLAHNRIERFADDTLEGIKMARAAGIDIMLMGPQYAPRFESIANRGTYMKRLNAIADETHTPLFPRYEIMKHWIHSGQLTVKTMITSDGLHLNDVSYACIGALVARMIANTEIETARR